MTGCERCDLNDKPTMSASGTFYDQQRDVLRGPWRWVEARSGRELVSESFDAYPGQPAVAIGADCDCDTPDGSQVCLWDATADHIARHDPARVLADVAAKRAIVDGHKMLVWARGDDEAPFTLKDREYMLRCVLKRLAAVWAGHPDYDERWKP